MYLTPNIKIERQHVECARLGGLTGPLRGFLSFRSTSRVTFVQNSLKRRIAMADPNEEKIERDLSDTGEPKQDTELSESDEETVVGGAEIPCHITINP